MRIHSFNITLMTDKNGALTPTAKSFFDQLILALQSVVSDQGLIPPKLSAATIAQLNTTASIGAIVYNTDTKKFMGNESGTFKTFTTT